MLSFYQALTGCNSFNKNWNYCLLKKLSGCYTVDSEKLGELSASEYQCFSVLIYSILEICRYLDMLNH